MIKLSRFFFLLLLFVQPCSGRAQFEHVQTHMARTMEYMKQGAYEKAIENYKEIIEELKDVGADGLIPTIREQMALCHIYLGVPHLKADNYAAAAEHFDWAAANAKPDGKVFLMARRYQAQNLGRESLALRVEKRELDRALALSRRAAEIFKAFDTDRMLKQHLATAQLYIDLHRNAEAKDLLGKVEGMGANDSTRTLILGQTYILLGGIEEEEENFAAALSYFQGGFELCEKAYKKGEANAKKYMLIAAQNLMTLYAYRLHDSQKAQYWEQRMDSLKN